VLIAEAVPSVTHTTLAALPCGFGGSVALSVSVSGGRVERGGNAYRCGGRVDGVNADRAENSYRQESFEFH
jgi:hypothetical protein